MQRRPSTGWSGGTFSLFCRNLASVLILSLGSCWFMFPQSPQFRQMDSSLPHFPFIGGTRQGCPLPPPLICLSNWAVSHLVASRGWVWGHHLSRRNSWSVFVCWWPPLIHVEPNYISLVGTQYFGYIWVLHKLNLHKSALLPINSSAKNISQAFFPF